MNFIRNIIFLIKREFKRVFKDTNLILVFLAAPLLYPAFYGSIYYNKTEEKVPIAVKDKDNTSLSRMLIREISAHQLLDVRNYNFSYEAGMEALANGKIQGIIEIPKDFEKNVLQGKPNSIPLILHSGRLLVLSDVGIPVSEIFSYFGAKIVGQYLSKSSVPVSQNESLVQPIRYKFNQLYNPFLYYGDMILPALLVIILSQLTFFSSAAATGKEWYDKTWSEILIHKNFRISSIFLAKILTYFVVFLSTGLLSNAVIIPIFKIHYSATFFEQIVLLGLGVLASASMGLFWGTFFRHKITAFAVLAFTSYPFFLMSGYAWPPLQLTKCLTIFSYIFPTTPFLQSSFLLAQTAASISDITPQIFNFIFIIIGYFIAFWIRIKLIKRSFFNKDVNP